MYMPANTNPEAASMRTVCVDRLMARITELMATGQNYRAAVRTIASAEELPVWLVRRATREHPMAPLP